MERRQLASVMLTLLLSMYLLLDTGTEKNSVVFVSSTNVPAALCKSSHELTANGSWTWRDPTISEIEAGRFTTAAEEFVPNKCALSFVWLRKPQVEICKWMSKQNINGFLFIGDSLSSNLHEDLRESVFGEKTKGLTRHECYHQRHSSIVTPLEQDVCRRSLQCNNQIESVWAQLNVLDIDPELAKLSNLLPFLKSFASRANNSIVITWIGAHYLLRRMNTTFADAITHHIKLLKILSEESRFRHVFVLGRPYGFQSFSGHTHFENEDALAMNEGIRRVSNSFNHSTFIDVFELTQGSGTIHIPDGIHPDQFLGEYILAIILQFIEVSGI